MKKLYFLFFLTIGLLANAQIVNIPDANFKAKLLSAISTNNIASTQTPIYDGTTDSWSVSSYNVIDTNSDGEIQVTEAQAIKWINVIGSNISNLIGIEAFTNLEYFNCSNKQLTSLNILSLTNLKSLICDDNQLTNLNVSGLTNLQNLRCIGAPLLTSVDVSTLTNLTDLWFSNTNITSLDVSNLTNLWRLVCDYTQLTSIDVSSNINLLRLYCRENQITSLDVSMLSVLNVLECYDNPLTELNIKNGNSNSWTTLDFYDNPNLQFVCADEEDVNLVQQKIDAYGYTSTCHVNSYCSFAPGGTFYDIAGNIKFDANNNGCDIADLNVPNLNLSISDGTTTGTLTPTSLTAPITPSAIMSQRTIPPKILMKTALTAVSDRIILNASTTRSLVAPPPTSKKLAGWPPCSLTMSMVPIARPAPLTIQPMSPPKAT